MATPDPKIPCGKCGLFTVRGMNRHVDQRPCLAQQEKNRRDGLSSSSQASHATTTTDQLIDSKPILSLLQKLRTTTRIIRRITKGARMTAATSFTDKLEDVLQQKSEATGSEEQQETQSYHHRHEQPLETTARHLQGREDEAVSKGEKKSKKQTAEASVKKIVEGKINDGDISGALWVLSSEDSVPVVSTEVLDILRAKHPPESPDAVFKERPDDAALPPEVTVEEVVAAVRSFPNGSAGGFDGLRPQHIKDMLAGASNGATVALAEALAKLMTQILHGKVPDNVREVLWRFPDSSEEERWRYSSHCRGLHTTSPCG
ncbi:hypothetical protein RvY_03952 [Ramazzottius varieornatus]|uniref:Reverse transcriptase domain-containing protein n=1 Tax=Ramazzottius varieornatus TaxID=947166 RepID=A0A1D1UPV2_RAMVA|nr:hypothetical protein RvY_03952 [Ramazzottius varieornatus]